MITHQIINIDNRFVAMTGMIRGKGKARGPISRVDGADVKSCLLYLLIERLI